MVTLHAVISFFFPYPIIFRSRLARRRRAGRVQGGARARYVRPHHSAGPRFSRVAAHSGRRDAAKIADPPSDARSEEHTSELQSHVNLVCRLLLEKKKKTRN